MNLIEGAVRILRFFSWLCAGVFALKDIRRPLCIMERAKVIACYEHEMPQDVESRPLAARSIRAAVRIFAVGDGKLFWFIADRLQRPVIWRAPLSEIFLTPLAGIAYEVLKLWARAIRCRRALCGRRDGIAEATTREPYDSKCRFH
jgi:hypothetical protein